MAVLSIRYPARRTPILIGALALAVAVLMLLPVVYLALRAAEHGTLFETLSADSTTAALSRTVTLAAAVCAGAIGISLPAAWLTARTDLPLRRAWGVAFALPLVFPSYVGAFVLVAALGPRGMLQDVLEPLGVERLPEIYGFFGAWLALTLFTFPLLYLPVRAALERLDPAMEEAARSLGSGAFSTFFRVTLPQLRPAIGAGLLLVFLYALSDFGVVSILRFDSLTRVIYIQYRSSFDRSEAAALALVLVGVAVLAVLLEAATRGRGRYHGQAVSRTSAVAPLGHWRWPALGFCVLVAAVSLVVPISVLAYWFVRGIDAGQSLDFMWAASWNSVRASGAGAAAAIIAALPIAIVSVRYRGAFGRVIEKLAYPGFALPGISVALALVFFAANYAPWIYQTFALLVVAYVIRFLPQGLGSVRTSLLQTNPATEQAGRALGRGPLYVFGRITLPQVLPGVTAGSLLVFLTVMKELPATLLLSPIGFNTLATEIWASTTEAMYARAAIPALALVAISAIPAAVFIARSSKSYE